MKIKVAELNQAIFEKAMRMKENIAGNFPVIKAPTLSSIPVSVRNSDAKIPPISYLLYGVAGLSVIAAIMANSSKLLYLGIGGISAYGGYKLSHFVNKKTENEALAEVNFTQLKNAAITEVVNAVKKNIEEWSHFMEIKQKEIQGFIQNSALSPTDKNRLASKIYLYEVLDISISDFLSVANKSTGLEDLSRIIDAYKVRVMEAIDAAQIKQIEKYSSLLN